MRFIVCSRIPKDDVINYFIYDRGVEIYATVCHGKLMAVTRTAPKHSLRVMSINARNTELIEITHLVTINKYTFADTQRMIEYIYTSPLYQQ